VAASCTFFAVGLAVLIFYGMKRKRGEAAGA
jgi:hypothetical protein